MLHLILSIVFSSAGLDLQIHPPAAADVMLIEVECSNGFYATSAREVTSDQHYRFQGTLEGECAIVAIAYHNKKVLGKDLRTAYH